MGTANVNTVSAINDAVTTAIQSSQSSCTATCTATSTGNTIIISGTTIGGNLDLSLKCEANALCTQQNSLDSSVVNFLKNATQQEATTSGFPARLLDANINTSALKNRTSTAISQFINSSCSATSTTLFANNLVYVTNSQIGGDVRLSQEGSATANCAQLNAAKLAVTNDLSNTAKQSATSSGLFGGAGGIIALLIVVGIVIAGIYIYNKSKAKPAANAKRAAASSTAPKPAPKPAAKPAAKSADL